MATSFHHQLSSARKWGGRPEEYRAVHDWFDESKEHFGDFRHRALRHHTQGVAECVERFGETLTLSTGRVIPVRWVAEQHVIEDLGYLPSLGDWFRNIRPEPWMSRARKLSQELETEAHA